MDHIIWLISYGSYGLCGPFKVDHSNENGFSNFCSDIFLNIFNGVETKKNVFS